MQKNWSKKGRLEKKQNKNEEVSEEEIPEITVHNGPYGPYLRFGDDTRSLGDDDDPFTITYSRARDILSEPKKFRRRQSKEITLKNDAGSPCTDPVSEKPIVLKEGRFGPYVTDGETNASLQLGDSVEQMNGERAKELLAERRAQQ